MILNAYLNNLDIKRLLESADDINSTFDPFEYLTVSIYENELAMMKLDAAIMCCEYAYLKENGEEMVYEAGAMKNFFAGAKKTLQAFWEKIKAFFKKILVWIQDEISNDAKFVKKYEKACEEAGNVKVDVKGYDFKGLSHWSNIFDITRRFAERVRVQGDEDDTIEVYDDYETDSVELIDNTLFVEELYYYYDQILRQVNAMYDENDGTFFEQFDEAIIKEQNFNSVDCRLQCRFVENVKVDKGFIEKMYTTTNTILTNMNRQLITIDKTLNSFNVTRTGYSRNARTAVQIIQHLCSCLGHFCNKGVAMIRDRRTQAKRFIVIALAEYNKNKDSANESSVYDDIFDSILG